MPRTVSRSPRIVRIRSEDNDFQYAETLRRRREKRLRQRELFVEGVRQINQALANGWSFRALLYSTERRLSGWARDVLERAGVDVHYQLPWELQAKLSQKVDTSELIALVRMPDDDLSRIPVREDLLVVVFDRPSSPGNLGTVIRSCDALGSHGLVITGHGVDLYDPETISASTGSLFSLPAVRLPSHKQLLPWLDELRRRLPGLQVVGSDEKGEVDVWAHDLTRPTVLIAGNETWGMSVAYRELSDTLVRIPIEGSASSLNVASAVSILLYEAAAQRRRQR
jgi:23S rRNA (uridine2479-2'-O)-methyltransferase